MDLLSKARKEDLVKSPFPYITIKDALPQDLADTLVKEYPTLSTVSGGEEIYNNYKYYYVPKDSLSNKELSKAWQEFLNVHLQPSFFYHCMDIFGEAVTERYPKVKKMMERKDAIRFGIKSIDTFDTADILLDANICIDSPVTEASSVKIAHLDHPRKLFVGNFYLRKPDDLERGGNLEVFAYNDSNFKFHGRRFLEDMYVHKIDTVPYVHNTFNLFVNCLEAVHGVEPRGITSRERYSFNVVVELRDDLFEIGPYADLGVGRKMYSLLSPIYRKIKSIFN